MKPVTHVVITPLRIPGWRGGGSKVKKAKPRKYLLGTKQNKQAGKVSSTMGFLSGWWWWGKSSVCPAHKAILASFPEHLSSLDGEH